MATVCGCCLAMLDAGVPLKRSVAGVAMGLIMGDGQHDEPVILTDILGLEDALGTMDFKVCEIDPSSCSMSSPQPHRSPGTIKESPLFS